MTFLNATLLFGLIAAAIPVAMHLIGRREPPRVVFPAVQFLTARFESNRRRLQVRRWVLMLMRCALIALLALALARPEVHRAATGTWLSIAGLGVLGLLVASLAVWAMLRGGSAALRYGLAGAAALLLVGSLAWGATAMATGDRPVRNEAAPTALVLVIDNAPTSAYEEGDTSRLERARDVARWMIARHGAHSRLAILDRSPRPAAFAIDPAAAVRTVDRTRPLHAPRPLAERVEAAVRLVRTSELPRRMVVVLSDLSQSSWGDDAGAFDPFAPLAGLIAEEPPVSVYLFDTGSPRFENRRLGEVRLADRHVPPGVSVPLSVEVAWQQDSLQQNSTSAPEGSEEREVGVVLELYESAAGLPVVRDDAVVYPPLRVVDRQTVRLAGEARGRVYLTLPPLELGTHHGRVRLAGSDPLAVDDVRYLTLRVDPPPEILIVADDADERETLHRVFQSGPSDEFSVTAVATSALAEIDLERFAAIALFDPPLPPRPIRDRLETWVADGGRLLLSLGPALDAAALGASGSPGSASGLDSAAVPWPLAGNPRRVWRVPDPGAFLRVVNTAHGAVRAFDDLPGGVPWSQFRVRRYWRLAEPDAGDRNGAQGPAAEENARSVAPGGQTLVDYAGTGHPALIDFPWGDGRVLVLTTPLPALVAPASAWNDLLSGSDPWPAWLLMRQAMADLTGDTEAPANVQVGDPVVVPPPAAGTAGGAGDSDAEATRRFQLFAPDEPPVGLEMAGGMIVPGPPTSAGNYWLRGEGTTLGYSANLSEAATRLERVDGERLDAIFGPEAYHVARERAEIERAEGEASDGRPLYAQAMLLASVFFVLEQLLSNRFYATRQRRSAGPGKES